MCEAVDIDKQLTLLQTYRGDSVKMKKLLVECDPCQACEEKNNAHGLESNCSCLQQYRINLQNQMYIINSGTHE